jgi:deferrochelatase/peroxidase EfeB
MQQRGPDRTYRPDLRAPTVYGLHQPGIATPQLRFARLTAYDADQDVRAQLAAWTEQAEGLMRDGGLTVTIGLGERNFKEQRPAGLKPLPPFKGDALEFSGGDLCALICSDAPIEASLPGRVRWEREGTHGTIGALGFRDGVVIPRRPLDLDRHVWVNRRDRVGMVGGTYLVVRDIHVLDSFRRLTPDEQERVIGRHRAGTEKYDLPPDSHVNLARRTHLLRRGYDTHQGVLFLAFTNDPRRTYVPLQHKLAEHDALHPHTRHTGSAVFAIPPGAAPRNFLAQPLL